MFQDLQKTHLSNNGNHDITFVSRHVCDIPHPPLLYLFQGMLVERILQTIRAMIKFVSS